MVNPDVWAPTPLIKVVSLPLLVSATPLQFTTNFRVWSQRPVFKAASANGFNVLIGTLLADGSVPTAIVLGTPGATEVRALTAISADGSWEPPTPRPWDRAGRQYQLKNFVAMAFGGGVDQGISVEYVRPGYGVTS